MSDNADRTPREPRSRRPRTRGALTIASYVEREESRLAAEGPTMDEWLAAVPLVTCDAKLAGANGHTAKIELFPTS